MDPALTAAPPRAPAHHRALTAVRRWLVGTRDDHARFMDMHLYFGSVPLFSILIATTYLTAALTYGWPLLVLVALAALTMARAQRPRTTSTCPEMRTAAAVGVLLVINAVSVYLTGGLSSPLLCLVALPVFTQAVRFRAPVTTAAAVLAGALTLLAAAAAAAAAAAEVVAAPLQVAPGYLQLLAYTTLLVCLTTSALQLARSDVASRGSAALDSLTGVYNRRALSNHFSDAVAGIASRAALLQVDGSDRSSLSGWSGKSGGSPVPIAVVVLDVDHFKAINDTYGHDRGDQVLVAVAARLAAHLREGDVLYRTGGEEFAVLAPGADEEAAIGIAERLRAAVSATAVVGALVSVSAGVAAAPAQEADLSELMRRADMGLYQAKRSGRNRVEAYAQPQRPPLARR